MLEAPSPFHSIRFPGHSENLFISSLSSLYISSSPPRLSLPPSQLYRYSRQTQHPDLRIDFLFLFSYYSSFGSLSFLFLPFRNDVFFNLVLCFGVSIP